MHQLPETGNFITCAVGTARRALLWGVLLLGFLAVMAVEGRAQTTDTNQAADTKQTSDANLTREQLEQLAAPIALYPDSLLAQILMASTYPLEIVQAARWAGAGAGANAKLKGKALEDALQMQPWDPSVKSIVVVPQVLQMMNDKLDWTEMLGNAFLAQQEDLMKAVQDLRAKADANGSLKTTSQQKVSKQSVSTTPAAGGTPAATNVIVIEPTDPQVMYVPAYNPSVVYGAWPYPTYPPYSWYPPGYVAGRALAFGAGVAVGAAIWGNVNWGGNNVNVNVNNFNNFNRTNVANGNWQHNADHRKGVAYSNSGVAERFGQKGGGSASAARDQFRGRAEGGQANRPNQSLPNRAGGQTPGQGANQRPAAGQGARNTGAGGANTKNTAAGGGAKNNAKNTKNAGAGAGKGQNRAAAGGGANAGAKALDGVGRGQSVRQESARGAASRDAMASSRGPAVSAGGGARPGGGGGGARAGGGGGGARAGGGGGGARAGGGGGGRGGGGVGGGRRSDLRLKHDVVLLGRLDNGLGFYRFSYNGSQKAYVGVIAQEVEAVMPQAVAYDRDGYLMVFYDKLGLTFETYDQWIRSGARVPSVGGTRH
jgi:hypothetical protein